MISGEFSDLQTATRSIAKRELNVLSYRLNGFEGDYYALTFQNAFFLLLTHYIYSPDYKSKSFMDAAV